METGTECCSGNYVLGAIVAAVICLWGIRKYVKGARYYGTARLDGKTVVITGGNTGIGKETAIDLAKRGAKVIIACRDMNKAKTAAEDIKRVSRSDNVHVIKLDLASFKSIRQCAESINKSEERLDVLLNNAGVMNCPHWLTEDGIEMQFGTNHVGHFFFTNLLLDLIKKSAPSRIINVSSLGHTFSGHLNFNDIVKREKSYNSTIAYAQSKLSNILFTKELAKKLEGTGVTTYALHPGTVDTELARHLRSRWFFMESFYQVMTFFLKTSYEGAQTNIYCAVEPSLEKETGKYYSDCAEKSPAKTAFDEAAAKKLWELSESLTNLKS